MEALIIQKLNTKLLNWKLTAVRRSMQKLQVFSSPGSLHAPLRSSSHRHEWDSITVPSFHFFTTMVAPPCFYSSCRRAIFCWWQSETTPRDASEFHTPANKFE